MSNHPSLKFSFLCLVLFGASACSDYWWERGQPPAVATLIERSKTRLDENRSTFRSERGPTADIAGEIETSLLASLQAVKTKQSPAVVAEHLAQAEKSFMNLEGKIAVTSRAAYGELSGQLRRFVADNSTPEGIQYAAFGTFTARTMFFLADELTVPAPTFG